MYPYYFYTYNPYHYANFYRQNQSTLVNDLQKAINGEYSAIICYEKLANMAKSQEEKNQILEIRDDERKHLEAFSSIYTHLTGIEPVPQISEECGATYTEGLIASFKDEQETVDFYLDIADSAHEPFIKEAFRRAAADEQNHAVWFSFFLMGQK
jgi:rubrerythrin